MEKICANPDIYREALGNGLIVILEKRSSDLVAISIGVKTGSGSEKPALNGISHFLEHVLFCGTKKYPEPQQVGRAMEALGGYINGSTNRMQTTYIGACLPKFFDKAFEILTDMVQNPLLKEEQVEKERKVIFEEISRRDDNPERLTYNLLYRTLFPDDPFGLPVSGTKESVSNATVQDIQGHFSRNYVPNNMIISVVGNFSTEKVMAQIGNLYSGMEAHAVYEAEAPSNIQDKPREAVIEKECNQAHVRLGLRLPGAECDDAHPLRLLNTYLGNGMGSTLFEEVRVKRRLAYSIGSNYDTTPTRGSFTAQAGIRKENIDEVRRIFEEQLEKLKRGTINEALLQRAKEYAVGRHMIAREAALNEAGCLFWFEQMGKLDQLNDWPKLLEPITSEELSAVTQKYLNPKKYCWAILKPKSL